MDDCKTAEEVLRAPDSEAVEEPTADAGTLARASSEGMTSSTATQAGRPQTTLGTKPAWTSWSGTTCSEAAGEQAAEAGAFAPVSSARMISPATTEAGRPGAPNRVLGQHPAPAKREDDLAKLGERPGESARQPRKKQYQLRPFVVVSFSCVSFWVCRGYAYLRL